MSTSCPRLYTHASVDEETRRAAGATHFVPITELQWAYLMLLHPAVEWVEIHETSPQTFTATIKFDRAMPEADQAIDEMLTMVQCYRQANQQWMVREFYGGRLKR